MQLCLVTKLADFYRALPVVSNALHSVFFGNLEFLSSIPENRVALLEASFKLRNKVLFKECYVHVQSPWNKPRLVNLKEKKLRDLATEGRHKLTPQILDMHVELATLTINSGDRDKSGTKLGSEMMSAVYSRNDVVDTDGKLMLPNTTDVCMIMNTLGDSVVLTLESSEALRQ
jgi:hypothetical protein